MRYFFSLLLMMPLLYAFPVPIQAQGGPKTDFLSIDSDGDGIPDDKDNCPTKYNPDQADIDNDKIGDLCDDCPKDPLNDPDDDKVCQDLDNCPDIKNPLQNDQDQDGIGDVCDVCPNDPLNDPDMDGICNSLDNCPDTPNPDQTDVDGDEIGDSCEIFNADFSASPLVGSAPLHVQFQNTTQTTEPITAVAWDFGLGQGFNSIEQNPLMFYEFPGYYTVRLIVESGALADTVTKTAYIHATGTDYPPFETSPLFFADMYFVKAADLDDDLFHDLIFSGSDSAALAIAFGREEGGFDEPIEISTAARASIATEFMNQDTLPDVVAATSQNLFVFLNQGNRTFSESQVPNDGGQHPSVATGYFNADNFADVVVSAGTIYYGDGQGGFTSTLSITPPFSLVEVADFNHDGLDDFVALHDAEVSIHINDGQGGFTIGGSIAVPVTDFIVSAFGALADFNSDGNMDFSILIPTPTSRASADGTTEYLVAFGTGDGGITDHFTFSLGGLANGVVMADVNRDYQLDLITTNGSEGSLVIRYGNGQGNFYDSSATSLGLSDAYALTTADFDRDGNSDFVCGSLTGGEVLLLINGQPDLETIPDQMVVTLMPQAQVGVTGLALTVDSPEDYIISREERTVAGSNFWRLDVNDDNSLDTRTFDYNCMYGCYNIIITQEDGAPEVPGFSASIGINGSQQAVIAMDYDGMSDEARNPFGGTDTFTFCYTVEEVSSIQPPNGMATNTPIPVFDWSGRLDRSTQAQTYQFQLDRYIDFRAPRIDTSGLPEPRYVPSSSLGVDSVWYWRFRTFDGTTWTAYSNPFAAYVTSAATCCFGYRGNVDCSTDDVVTISDLAVLIDHMFINLAPLCCEGEGDVNADGSIDISDITDLIERLFLNFQPMDFCTTIKR